MPDPFEFPRVRRPVVPLVRARHAVVDELVAGRLPCLAAVVRPLGDLAEPSRRLGGIEPVGVGRRSFEVVDLPAPEMRSADVPTVPLPVRAHHERALTSTDQQSYVAHRTIAPFPVLICKSTMRSRGSRFPVPGSF